MDKNYFPLITAFSITSLVVIVALLGFYLRSNQGQSPENYQVATTGTDCSYLLTIAYTPTPTVPTTLTNTPTLTPTPTPTPTNTPVPGQCGAVCSITQPCGTGMTCSAGLCALNDYVTVCTVSEPARCCFSPTATPTPTPTMTPTSTPTNTPGASATPTPTNTPVPSTLACGNWGCNSDSNCRDGNVCVWVNDDRSRSGYCAMNDSIVINNCKSGPTTDRCCSRPRAEAQLQCGQVGCTSNSDCAGSGMTCVTANSGNKYCAMTQYADTCKNGPTSARCCAPVQPELPKSGGVSPTLLFTLGGIVLVALGLLF